MFASVAELPRLQTKLVLFKMLVVGRAHVCVCAEGALKKQQAQITKKKKQPKPKPHNQQQIRMTPAQENRVSWILAFISPRAPGEKLKVIAVSPLIVPQLRSWQDQFLLLLDFRKTSGFF